ncbi:iron ABC transporter substrate-binding protein [Chloroflexota bacterium]
MKTRATKTISLILAAVIVISTLAGCGNSNALITNQPDTRMITDMYGRELTVPAKINRVLCTGSVEMIMTYLIAPEKLIGLNFSSNGDLIKPEYKNLPVMGGWTSNQAGNYETFISMKPDIIIEGRAETLEERQAKFGSLPVVGVGTNTSLTEYEPPLRFMGELLGVPERAENLIQYYKEAMNFADSAIGKLPDSEIKTVYYAEGKVGLNTDPAGSQHTELIEFCGGRNVADIAITQGYGMAEVSMEQLLLWNPDVIIIGRASQASLYQMIIADSKWQQLKAVKQGQVFVRPDDPFSWFDGPVGPNQIIGIYWTLQKLHPDLLPEEKLKEKVKEFYSGFYHYDLSNTELSKLLGN